MTCKKFDENSTIQEILDNPIGNEWLNIMLLIAGVPSFLARWSFFRKLTFKTALKWFMPGSNNEFWLRALEITNEHTDITLVREGEVEQRWWKDAIFYQIYPASFYDSNEDGIGDLNGITYKLNYIQSLGVDVISLAPIMEAVNKDFGFDVTNYKAVMPEMGTMEDFERLVSRVHECGMKMVLEVPINHTSDQHPWFQEALRDPDGPYGQYYYLRRGKQGSPPNNWASRFGTQSAWCWFPEQELYALHLFSDYQMDLNWDNPELRREMYDNMRFWLDKGVDGLHFSDSCFLSKREGLPDGFQSTLDFALVTGWENYMCGPKIHKYHREIRREVFEPYGACFIGEIPLLGSIIKHLLSSQNRKELDLYIDFDHLENPFRRRYDENVLDMFMFKKYFINAHRAGSEYEWNTILFENHDLSRMISKVDPTHFWRERLSKFFLLLMLTMRGTPFIYQGQELGEANQPFRSIDELKDLMSLVYYEKLKSVFGERVAWDLIQTGTRDHARIPMHWNSGFNGGFTQGDPYVKRQIPDYGWDAATQERDPYSVLSTFRQLTALRSEHPALIRGSIRFICPSHKRYFAYLREYEGETLLCEFNLTRHAYRKPAEARNLKRGKVLFTNLARPLAEGRKKEYVHQMMPYEAVLTIIEE